MSRSGGQDDATLGRRDGGGTGRLEFRGLVDAPRPAAAWLMVAVASAALWITGQVPTWALIIQAGA